MIRGIQWTCFAVLDELDDLLDRSRAKCLRQRTLARAGQAEPGEPAAFGAVEVEPRVALALRQACRGGEQHPGGAAREDVEEVTPLEPEGRPFADRPDEAFEPHLEHGELHRHPFQRLGHLALSLRPQPFFEGGERAGRGRLDPERNLHEDPARHASCR